jgi:hypothetical protein
MIDTLLPSAVIQAMSLLDVCADDIEVAQMFIRTRLWGKDLEEVVCWGEILEVLRTNQRNQA